MSMRDWLVTRDPQYDPDNAVAIKIDSDGFSRSKSKPFAISVRGVHVPEQTIYIAGADVASVEKYTGVSDSYYKERAVGIERAWELLADLVHEAEFLVSYNVENYQRPWLDIAVPKLLKDLPILDIMHLIRVCDSGQHLPEDLQEVGDLQGRCQTSVGHMKGYGMPAVCARCIPGYVPEQPGDIVLERKISDLWSLWIETLDRNR